MAAPKKMEVAERPPKQGWDAIEHFKPVDFVCKCDNFCDHKTQVSMDLVQKLDAMAEELGLPLQVLAGTRCRGFNLKCGGTTTSALVPGPSGFSHGVDLAIPDDSFRYKLVRAAMAAGINRIALRRESLHLDDTPGTKPSLRFDATRK
jgi:hypothetical protein